MVRAIAFFLMTSIAASGVAAPSPAVTTSTPDTTRSAATSQAAPLSIEWTELPEMPVGTSGHAAADSPAGPMAIGGTSWLDGQKRWHDQVWRFDVADRAWRQADKLPARLAYAVTATTDAELLLLGGASNNDGVASVVAIRHAAGGGNNAANGKADRHPLPGLPEARALAFGGAVGEWLVVGGGASDPNDPKTATDRTMRLNPTSPTRKWEDAAPLPGGPLILAASAVSGGKLYVFGGMGAADVSGCSAYQPERNRWTPIAPLPSPRRGAAAVAVGERFILIVGGCMTERGEHTMLDEVLAYDTAEDRYHALDRLPYAAVTPAAVMHDGRLYVFGGEDRPRSRIARAVAGRLRWNEALR